jgi:hypothetical protein
MDLAQFILFNNYLSFNNQVYLQLRGTAMGTPFAVTFACIYMSMLEMEAIKVCKTHHPAFIPPLLLSRYIDDIFAIFDTTLSASLFFTTFNTLRPTIKLTFNISSPSQPFLDLTIFKGPRFTSSNQLDTTLYQKPINKYQYISPESFHPHRTFTNFIHSELRRYRLACTHDTDFSLLKSLFSTRLTARGYPPNFIEKQFNSFTATRNELLINLPKPPPFVMPSRINSFLPISHNSCAQTNGTTHPITLIYKNNPRIPTPSLRQCFTLPSAITDVPTLFAIFDNRQPMICLKNAPSITTMLVRSSLPTL